MRMILVTNMAAALLTLVFTCWNGLELFNHASALREGGHTHHARVVHIIEIIGHALSSTETGQYFIPDAAPPRMVSAVSLLWNLYAAYGQYETLKARPPGSLNRFLNRIASADLLAHLANALFILENLRKPEPVDDQMPLPIL